MPRSRKLSSKKSKSRKRPAAAQDEGWYTIRRILDERTVKGRVEYLVDWDDNTVTGQAYDPTWDFLTNVHVPQSSEVTSIAKVEWEKVKARRRGEEHQLEQQLEQQLEHQFEPGPGPDPELDPEQQLQDRQQPEQSNHQEPEAQPEPASDQESDNSQPPRPAHQRRINKKRRRSASLISSSSTSSPIRPRKAPRSDTCGSLYDEPPASLASSPSISTPSELPELPDVDLSEYRSRATSLVVEIPKNSNLNPADYSSVIGSQSSGKSTQSLAELENEDSRVAIARNSQGTVPDSQEITDRSWTQQQIPAGLPPSSNRLIESQPQDIIPESSSHVIPDSFEAPSKPISQGPGKETKERHDSSLSNHNPTDTASEDRIQESHATVSSDIPSRQPDQLREVSGAGSPVLSESLSHNTSGSPDRQPLASSGSAVSIHTQQDATPRFFTQPFFATVLEIPESSLPSRILESPAHPAAGIASTYSSSTLSASDSGASQAAQIVPRDFEAPTQQPLMESKSQESLAQSSPNRPREAANLLPQQSAPARFVGHPGDILGSPAKPKTPLNSYKGQKMENETPEQAKERQAKERHSLGVVAALSDIFNLDELNSEADSTSHQSASHQIPLHQISAEEPAEHHAPLEKGVPNTYTELPVHSTDLPHGAKTPGGNEKEQAGNMVAAAATESTGNDRDTTTSTLGPQISTPQEPIAAEVADIYGPAFVGAELEPPTVAAPEFIPAQQSTVSLADISRQPEPAYKDIPLVPFVSPSETMMQEHSTDTAHSEQVQREHSPAESSVSFAASAAVEHVVTLPFQASLRQRYNDFITEFKTPIQDFNKSFSDEHYSEPDPLLVNRIDELFNILLNVCDYPEDVVGSDLETLPPAELAKYCCDANPKFNFLFELLSGIIKHHLNILIIARSPDLLRLLCHLAEALKMPFSCDALGESDLSSADSSSSKLVLALPTGDIDAQEFDVVIGYDHSFRNSSIAQGLRSADNNRQQLILVLVTTYSIEHIDPQISDDLTLIERKSVLVSGIVGARNLVASPERGYLEPHEIAALFIEYLTGDQQTLLWEAIPVPDTVLDVYVHSQSRSQMLAFAHHEQESGRKRKHNESDVFETKRPRVLSTSEATAAIGTGQAPVSDEVRAMLAQFTTAIGDSSRPQVLINVSHASLQKMAEMFAEYRRNLEAADCGVEYRAVISSLEKRVKEYERTTHRVYEAKRAALQDRSRFEAERHKMEEAMQSAVAQSEKEAEKAKKTIMELEATVARLTEDPNASDPQNTPLAKTEKLLHDTQSKVSLLEKRLENAHKDADYIRNLYQDAASTASGLKSENNQLRSQNEELAKKASENFVKIHEIQKRDTANMFVAQVAELNLQIQQRERELDLANEELRQLKNGRRETRQSSVPRSPRMGMLSPLGRAYGGPGSRGASPALGPGTEGMQHYGQQPRNRYNHLK
ncbi:uncharacterized protein Triagg1_6171 [Trichoderma aggressivum f. europaeum]|uniref:Chromo domain-containing protein n=1 Tax=Trichoderma aggressivum f. europaeum TaxID=173218 RepID=A0AAE1LYY4_9HYPO|nr:hypothetical protein Triagg1_6171 [Trichoderma aggressivum f. europaeum]